MTLKRREKGQIMAEDRYQKYFASIPEGKQNGISNVRLQKTWNTDRRGVSAIVEGMRNAGMIIASGNTGYYRPADLDELAEFYFIHHARAVSLLKALKTTRAELKKAGKLNEQKN